MATPILSPAQVFSRSDRAPALMVEMLGVIASIRLDNFDFERLVSEYNLIPWVSAHLDCGMFSDDIILETVQVRGFRGFRFSSCVHFGQDYSDPR
jgi:kinesin-associated protein (KAP)